MGSNPTPSALRQAQGKPVKRATVDKVRLKTAMAGLVNFLIMAIFIISIALILVVLGEITIFVLLISYFRRTSKLFRGAGGKKIMDVLAEAMQRADLVEKELNRAVETSARDRKVLQNTLHKVGLVRFNPFEDMGGAQSFALALLNAQNDGVLITSLYSKDGMRTFSKKIKAGVGEQALSHEEERAVREAMVNLS